MGETNYAPVIDKMTWSYSRLKAFSDCPYRWYLKYLRWPHHAGRDLFFASYGKFVHELAAAFFSGSATRDEVYLRYLSEFRQQIRSFPPNRKVYTSYLQDGADYLRHVAMPSDGVVAAVEQEVHFSVGGHPFVGYLDRVDRLTDGSLRIVDHKQRKLKPWSGRQKPTKQDEELAEYLRQLYLYAAALEQGAGALPSQLCLNCFRSGEQIVEPFDPVAYRAALTWAEGAIGTIAQETEFPPRLDWFRCTYLCEMQDLCEYF